MTNVERRMLRLMLAGTLALALLLLGFEAVTPDVGHAAARTTTMSLYRDAAASHQQTGKSPPSDDQRVPVQVWTIMAAGAAAAVGLLLFFVRIALGRVAPPPPQEDAPHH